MNLCDRFNKECTSGSGTRSKPIVYRKAKPYGVSAQILPTAFPQSGSLEPKRFKRRFAFFAAVGKEGRPAGRNIPFSFTGKGRRAGARNTPSVAFKSSGSGKFVLGIASHAGRGSSGFCRLGSVHKKFTVNIY